MRLLRSARNDGFRIASVVFFACLFSLAESAFAVDEQAILDTFELHPDFRIEIVAMEPTVFDPVDVEFDEHGRPFVVEMSGYPFADSPGRVVLLKDLDGDGRYETRQVFAEGFPVATSILPHEGGFLVASPPDLLFLKDTDGDDVADVREVVLTGFKVDNPQHNFNGLVHGIDNWVYGANGGNGGLVRWADGNGESVGLRSDDFRVDLHHRRFERVGRSTGGFGITFDAWGRMFGTHNLYPLSHLVFPGRYLVDLPQPRGGTLKKLPDDAENGLVRIYPIGEQDTRVNHPEQSGYFSGSCGVTFYGGGSFGRAFEDNVFVCDVVLNLIHRRVLVPEGTSFSAKRAREKVEFLASTDRAFRPVTMTVAPDGSLWVVDMHRDVIEHPEWIPDEIEKGLDLDAGKQAGRIFRIAPKDGLPGVSPSFEPTDIQNVVDALAYPNRWWRMTAQRLLVEWGDARAVPLLEALATESREPHARAHALWTLEGLDALPDALLLDALDDEHAGVREQAAQLATERLGDTKMRSAVAALLEDPSPRVRMSAALAVSTAPAMATDEGVQHSLARLALSDAEDPWMRLALLANGAHSDALLYTLVSATGRPGEGRLELIRDISEARGRRYPGDDRGARFADLVERTGDDSVLEALLDGLADGLATRPTSLGAITLRRNSLRALEAIVRRDALGVVRAGLRAADALGATDIRSARFGDPEVRALIARVSENAAPVDERLDRLRLLAFVPFGDRDDLLYALLDARLPAALQREAIDQLGAEGSSDVAARLIAMWRMLGPATRAAAGDILLYKRGNHDLLLSALEDGTVSLGEMNLHLERRRTLLHSRNEDIVRRAQALFSDAGVVTRGDAIEAMRPALSLDGDAAKGRAVFGNLCIRCHRMGLEGGDLGPNLSEIARKSKETLLHDVLDPNAAVNNEFVSYTVETRDGSIYSGIIESETGDAVILRDANGVPRTLPRADMREMYSNGLSLMPEELEAGLEPQAIADLLAYLQQPK